MRVFSYACSLSVMGQRWSCTIRSAVPENPMLHANIIALCLIERELLPIEVLHCGDKNFRHFGSSDLDLDPMTFIRPRPVVRGDMQHVQHELHTSRLSKVIVWQTYIHTYRQTDTQTGLKLYATPLRGCMVKNIIQMHVYGRSKDLNALFQLHIFAY